MAEHGFWPIKLDDPDNGRFLGNLEFLSRHNQVLKVHLNEVKKHQETETRMQAHCLSWPSQNEFIEECAKVVINVIIEKIKRALYYSIIVDGSPDTSHTEQITFILRYAYPNDKNLWEVCERFLEMRDCEKKKGCDIAELICNIRFLKNMIFSFNTVEVKDMTMDLICHVVIKEHMSSINPGEESPSCFLSL